MKVTHEWGSDLRDASNSTDVSYHAVRAYYDIYAHTRARASRICCLKYATTAGAWSTSVRAAHGDYFSITDTYDPLSNRRAFYDTSYLLPAAMLESYVEKWPAPQTGKFPLHAAQRHDGLGHPDAGHPRGRPNSMKRRSRPSRCTKRNCGR